MSDRRSEPDGGSTMFDEQSVSDEPTLSVPLDIVVLLGVLAVSVPIILGVVPVPGAVRVLVGLPFVLFLPGYSLTTALFPRRSDVGSGEELTALGGEAIPRRIRALSERGLTLVERLALGLGVSIVIAPVIMIVIDTLSLGLGATTITGAFGALTAVTAVVAIVRHRRLPSRDATGRTLSTALDAFRAAFGRSSGDAVLVLAVTVCVLFAGVAGAFALVAPQEATSFTNIALVTQTDDGDYVSAGYPTEFTVGEPQTMHVAVRNDERTETTYTVVAQLNRVRETDDGLTVLSRNRIGRVQTTVPSEETAYVSMDVAPETVGENLRLTYLLYKGEPPQTPTTGNAYRSTYIWINSTASGS